MGHVTEQPTYDGRPSMDSRRSSDSNYMLGQTSHEYLPHCEAIDEYMSMRTCALNLSPPISIDRAAESRGF